jgi:hypothetical protein
MQTLFDRLTRTSLLPARFAEPDFIYLNESARPEIARVRRLLERWYMTYPFEVS